MSLPYLLFFLPLITCNYYQESFEIKESKDISDQSTLFSDVDVDKRKKHSSSYISNSGCDTTKPSRLCNLISNAV